MSNYYEVIFNGRVKFSSVSEEECQEFATDLLNDEKRNPGKAIVPEVRKNSK